LSVDLFVYGTLMDEETVQQITGRRFAREVAILPDFERVENPREYPYVFTLPGARVAGFLLLDIDPLSLSRLDEYEEEGRLYHRREVAVLVGSETRTCFAYIRMRS
jgi:gamma-glutamylcyclotransferase (GGCT)/AIG2-like uncharacterized protein YtfP